MYELVCRYEIRRDTLCVCVCVCARACGACFYFCVFFKRKPALSAR